MIISYLKRIFRIFTSKSKSTKSNYKISSSNYYYREYQKPKLTPEQRKIKDKIEGVLSKMSEFDILDSLLNELSILNNKTKTELIEKLLKMSNEARETSLETLHHLCRMRALDIDVISKKEKILNIQEQIIFNSLTKMAKNKQISIYPQVALNAIVNYENEAWYAIGNKYVDFLIVNFKTSQPLIVIEYFGGWHYGKDNNKLTKMKVENNDEIKRKIFESANIKLIIIHFEDIKENNSNKIDIKKLEKYVEEKVGTYIDIIKNRKY